MSATISHFCKGLFETSTSAPGEPSRFRELSLSSAQHHRSPHNDPPDESVGGHEFGRMCGLIIRCQWNLASGRILGIDSPGEVRPFRDPHKHQLADAKEAYLRWQKTAIEQLGYVINLFLTLAVGSLGFAVKLM